MEYIIIIALIVGILALLFLRKSDESKWEDVDTGFKHSGHKWVFNGILDIDNPPDDPAALNDYDGKIDIMVKKGYVRYELDVLQKKEMEQYLGLFHAVARPQDDALVVECDGHVLGKVMGKTNEFFRQQESIDAYGFIARKDDHYYGDICLKK